MSTRLGKPVADDLSWCSLRLRLMGLQHSRNPRHDNEAAAFSAACNKQLAATCQCDKSASFFGRRVTYSPASRKVCNASPLASTIGSSNLRDQDMRAGDTQNYNQDIRLRARNANQASPKENGPKRVRGREPATHRFTRWDCLIP